MPENFRYILDGLSLSVVVTALTGILPPVAALMSIAWLSVQFYDRFFNKDKK